MKNLDDVLLGRTDQHLETVYERNWLQHIRDLARLEFLGRQSEGDEYDPAQQSARLLMIEIQKCSEQFENGDLCVDLDTEMNLWIRENSTKSADWATVDDVQGAFRSEVKKVMPALAVLGDDVDFSVLANVYGRLVGHVPANKRARFNSGILDGNERAEIGRGSWQDRIAQRLGRPERHPVSEELVNKTAISVLEQYTAGIMNGDIEVSLTRERELENEGKVRFDLSINENAALSSMRL